VNDELAEGRIPEIVLDCTGPTGEPIPWRVYRDPAGHAFCLVIR
jgi:hypothetical protein